MGRAAGEEEGRRGDNLRSPVRAQWSARSEERRRGTPCRVAEGEQSIENLPPSAAIRMGTRATGVRWSCVSRRAVFAYKPAVLCLTALSCLGPSPPDFPSYPAPAPFSPAPACRSSRKISPCATTRPRRSRTSVTSSSARSSRTACTPTSKPRRSSLPSLGLREHGDSHAGEKEPTLMGWIQLAEHLLANQIEVVPPPPPTPPRPSREGRAGGGRAQLGMSEFLLIARK